jgi:transposase-like protein
MYEIDGTTYLTTTAAARRIGVVPGTLRNWRTDEREDRLPSVKLGASVLYRESDVSDYLSRHGRH